MTQIGSRNELELNNGVKVFHQYKNQSLLGDKVDPNLLLEALTLPEQRL